MFRNLTTLFPAFFRKAVRTPTAAHIFHTTDHEGSSFFYNAIKRNKVINYHPDKGLFFNETEREPHAIFGGDVTDRGELDLELLEILINFKKSYPQNVTLLAGNRDIKNARFKIELAPNLIRERLLQGASPRWLTHRTVPLDYVIADRAKNLKLSKLENSDDDLKNYVESLSTEQCQLIYLKWMLEKTMGCPHTFRYRREELRRKFGVNTISDETVLQSFINESVPTGLIGQYLQLSQVGVIVPNTGVMAVHGGLTEYNIGRIPDMSPNEAPIADAALWIERYNAWYAKQVQKWINYIPTELTEPAFTELDESVLPFPGKKKYIVTADMLDKDRQFTAIPSDVGQYLRNNGISIVLTGHQPSGDHPALLRDDENSVLFINNDTGYAKHDPSNPDDTRGSACHATEILADRHQAEVHIHATLSDAVSVKTQLKATPEKIEGDDYIGKVLPDNYLVQCRLPNGDYRLAKQKGFRTEYSTIKPDKLAEMIDSQRPTQPTLL